MNRVQIEITLGTLFIFVTSFVFLGYAVNEETRMQEAAKAQQARAIEQGAALFEQQCSRCHGTQGTGIPGLCPPLNDRNFFDNRLKEVGWSGGLEDYIVATASSGRLASSRPEMFPGQGTPAMPSFSAQFGGPLRDDQVRNIAAFIMNWEETAAVVELPAAPTGPLAGDDITKALPAGDAAKGEKLTTSLGCAACHMISPSGVGPYWPADGGNAGIGERAAAYLTEDGYTGKAASAEQYLFEAIVAPGAYVVSGYAEGVMPPTYATTLTEADLADIIAYLLTLK